MVYFAYQHYLLFSLAEGQKLEFSEIHFYLRPEARRIAESRDE